MLTIDAHIPFDAAPDDAEGRSELAPEDALQVLRALNLLALSHRYESADAPSAEANHDLARLEAKVDMLLALVGSLVTEQAGLPPTRAVRFSAESVQANLDRRYPLAASVVLTLYLSRELPRPLYLAASVASVDPRAAGSFAVTFKLGPLNGTVKDEIERYIFLRHRKMLSRKSAD